MNTKRKEFDVLVYHDNCMDGLTALAIAAVYCDVDCIKLPGDYTEEFDLDLLQDKHVCFLDYSTKRPTMVNILDVAASVTVIDHHVSAWDELHDITDDNFNFVYDVKRSGAQIAWDYFTELPQPVFIKLIGDRDLWTKKYEASDDLNLALRVIGGGYTSMRLHVKHLIDINKRHDLLDHKSRALIRSGHEFRKYHNYLVDIISKSAYLATLPDGKDTQVWKVNCPLGMMSDVGAALAKTSVSGVAWLYSSISDTEVKHSLRVSANSDYDAAAFAATQGGGGHIKAAGWLSNTIESL